MGMVLGLDGWSSYFLADYLYDDRLVILKILLLTIIKAESPRYTIIEKNDESTGRKVLEKLRGTTNVIKLINQIKSIKIDFL